MEGERQGRIEGSGQHHEQEGLIEIFSFDHEVAIPRRGTQALTAGRPVHQEIQIGKLVDRATPKLYQALDQSEIITLVEFEWFAFNRSGTLERVFAIELENALVTSIRPSMPNYIDPTYDRYRFMEQVGLCYESIVWSYGQGDVQFEAAWRGEEA
jgi:type VI secretion system secreted protein Hcp